MRLVEIPGKSVGDVSGLMSSLRATGLRVANVASHQGKTYVWLEDGENGNPSEMVSRWQDVAALSATVDAAEAEDRTYELPADGKSRFAVVIRKTDTSNGETLPGEDRLVAISSRPAELSDDRPTLSAGIAAFMVGPALTEKEFRVRVVDPAGRMIPCEVPLRFVTATDVQEEISPEDPGWLVKVARAFSKEVDPQPQSMKPPQPPAGSDEKASQSEPTGGETPPASETSDWSSPRKDGIITRMFRRLRGR